VHLSYTSLTLNSDATLSRTHAPTHKHRCRPRQTDWIAQDMKIMMVHVAAKWTGYARALGYERAGQCISHPSCSQLLRTKARHCPSLTLYTPPALLGCSTSGCQTHALVSSKYQDSIAHLLHCLTSKGNLVIRQHQPHCVCSHGPGGSCWCSHHATIMHIHPGKEQEWLLQGSKGLREDQRLKLSHLDQLGAMATAGTFLPCWPLLLQAGLPAPHTAPY
jgi:hypothetical protein